MVGEVAAGVKSLELQTHSLGEGGRKSSRKD